MNDGLNGTDLLTYPVQSVLMIVCVIDYAIC